MSEKNLEKELIDTYNQVDHFLRDSIKSERHLDHGSLLKEAALRNPVVARHLQEMRSLSQLRNTIIHNPFGSEISPLITPNQIVVDRYKAILESLKHPPTALSIAIEGQNIYTAKKQDRLMDVLKKMDDNIFTHVPIIEKGEMVGILSENALLSYIADMEDVIIDSSTKVDALSAYIPLNKHRGESFKFLPRDATLEEVFNMFNEAIKVRERIGMVFITHNGKQSEKLLGILTAWDLANFELGSLV